ncbi:MAG: hypothetical protein ACTSVV_15840, partial [Promethearchaeota archaeon]
FQIHALWSKEVMDLVDEILEQPAKSYATQHDIILRFINKYLHDDMGEFSREYRVKGGVYPDLKIPSDRAEQEYLIIEFKVRTSMLKYLKLDLKKRDIIFSHSDCLYFSFFLIVSSKSDEKILLERACIYYLVILKIYKSAKNLPLDALYEAISMGTEEFIEDLVKESELDDDEELLGVKNMIKVADLERRYKKALAEKEKILKEKDEILKEKDEILKEKDEILKEKDEMLKEKDEMLKEKEEELQRERQLREQKERLLKEKEKEVQRLKKLLEEKRR